MPSEYEFTELEHFVSVQINPVYLRFENVTDELLNQYAVNCLNACEKSKKRFHQAVLAAGKKSRINIYIHHHQACLIRFADDIYGYLISYRLTDTGTEDYAEKLTVFYEKVYRTLNNLLLYLEKDFNQYFNEKAKLTRLCKSEFTKTISVKVRQLRKHFRENTITDELVQIVTLPFYNLQDDSTCITYHRRNYLVILLVELLETFANKTSPVTDGQLRNILTSLNYNSLAFFNFSIRQFATVTGEMTSDSEIIHFYLLQLKLLNQVTIKPSFINNKQLPGIPVQIKTWINEELAFLERKQQHVINHSPILSGPLPAKAKIHTTLGVSQLSLGLKLLIDGGIITNSNYTELIKIVAQNFKTDRADHISEESLRNKYYNIDQTAAVKMKEVVINLLNLVRSY